MNIGVIGVGKLGLSFALLCEQKGHNVIGSDVNESYINSLMRGSYKTSEPYIQEYLESSKILFTTDNIQVVEQSDIIFLFVPTPSLYTGEYDHQYIEQAIDSIKDCNLTEKIVVIGCTTMPGYTQTVQDKLDCAVLYNPEFIAQGDIINGLKRADMVLIGGQSSAAKNVLMRLYKSIMDVPLNARRMSSTAAEITKISINCFLTMKIAYANTIGEIAINSGVQDEVSTILTAIGDDSRIGKKYLGYGFGYGGPCLPRDMRALGIHANNVGLGSILQNTVDIMNDTHHDYLIGYYIARNSDKTVPFIFPQISYKKGVEMIVESQQLRLAVALQEAGYTVYTTDTIESHIPHLPEGITGYTIDI